MNNQEYNPVSKYYVKCSIYGGESIEYTVMAQSLEWAMTMINRQVKWDEVMVTRITGVIALALYGARNITNDPDENFSLHYHAVPVNKSKGA